MSDLLRKTPTKAEGRPFIPDAWARPIGSVSVVGIIVAFLTTAMPPVLNVWREALLADRASDIARIHEPGQSPLLASCAISLAQTGARLFVRDFCEREQANGWIVPVSPGAGWSTQPPVVDAAASFQEVK